MPSLLGSPPCWRYQLRTSPGRSGGARHVGDGVIRRRVSVSRRALVGLGLGLWITLIAFGSLRARVAGPEWGVHVVQSFDGEAIADSVDRFGAGFADGVRPGDIVISVDGVDAHSFIDDQLPSSAYAVTVRKPDGETRMLRANEWSLPLLGMLTGGALLFVVLGGLVYRWSADPILGRLFLLFSASFATALAALPAAMLGHLWAAAILTPTAALFATPSLFGLFLSFPRPIRFARNIRRAVLLLAIPLAVLQTVVPALRSDLVAIFDNALWFWVMLNLLGALTLLIIRASRRTDRRALTPLLLGTALGVGPLVILVAVPKLLGLQQG